MWYIGFIITPPTRIVCEALPKHTWDNLYESVVGLSAATRYLDEMKEIYQVTFNRFKHKTAWRVHYVCTTYQFCWSNVIESQPFLALVFSLKGYISISLINISTEKIMVHSNKKKEIYSRDHNSRKSYFMENA